jgi:aryl-alcohol dehydrogenase-like predicted oxidoreductase
MKYRRLGDSGLLVSELGLGTMTFGEESERGVAAAEARRIIEAYLEAGGNHFDVADVYAGGRAEEIVGEAVRDARDRIVLATKVRWPMGLGPNDAGLSRYHILKAVEASLRRLRTDAIDVLYLHGWDPWTPLQESMAALADLVASGKVRYVAVSNFKAWQVMKALAVSDLRGWPRFIAAQYQYSLVSRGIEQELTELFAAEGVGLVPWAPLGGGFLTGRYRRGERPEEAAAGRLATAPDDWEESWVRRATDRNWAILDVAGAVARRRGCTVSQVALRWLLAQPTVSSVVVGVRNAAQLADNLGAAAIELDREEVIALTEASKVPLAYPYRSAGSDER